jgi:antitoxin component of RelBE/YafQ-DinJ toxin-antitoxin module
MSGKSTSKTKAVTRSAASGQLLFRYRESDTLTGVSRKTASRLAKTLGLTETQAIHLALARLAQETLPRYEADNTPLTEKQLQAINRLEQQGRLVTGETLFAS